MKLKDVEKVLIAKTELKERIEQLGDEISKDFGDNDILAIGILKGSVIFLADLIRCISNNVSLDFMTVSSYGNGAVSTGKLTIKKDLDVDIKGKLVLIVEDIIDSGITLSKLKEELLSREPASLKICTLLNKPERRTAKIDVDYIGFDIPNEFIIGYGLDYAEKYRELPFIGVLKREIYE